MAGADLTTATHTGETPLRIIELALKQAAETRRLPGEGGDNGLGGEDAALASQRSAWGEAALLVETETEKAKAGRTEEMRGRVRLWQACRASLLRHAG